MFGIDSADWHLHFASEFDLREVILMRRRQKASLGRYGRQAFNYWEGRPAHEIDWAITAFDKVMEREKSAGNPEDM